MTSKESLVRAAVHESYLPLQAALQQEYPNRYPRVCGPSSVVLTRSRWLQALDIPLRLGGSEERYELALGIFNPDSSSPHQPDDHTHVRYYTGTGEVLFIDPIYPLLWGDGKHSAAPIIKRYPERDIDRRLAEEYSLSPFDDDLAVKLNIPLQISETDTSLTARRRYDDLRTAMHDERVLADVFVADSGDTIDVQNCYGERITRLLNAVGGVAIDCLDFE